MDWLVMSFSTMRICRLHHVIEVDGFWKSAECWQHIVSAGGFEVRRRERMDSTYVGPSWLSNVVFEIDRVRGGHARRFWCFWERSEESLEH